MRADARCSPRARVGIASAVCGVRLFLLAHIRIEPYAVDKDGQLQFWSLWSVMSSLFLGILLKANMQVSLFQGIAIELTLACLHRTRTIMALRR